MASLISRMSRLVTTILLTALLAAGCQACRKASDTGHRLLDRDGLPPQKFLALLGAMPGYAVAIPVGLVMVPTYFFEDLHYPSGPDHDAEMPLVFAPFELSGGVGAWLLGRPLDLALRGLRLPPRSPQGDGGPPEPETGTRPEIGPEPSPSPAAGR